MLKSYDRIGEQKGKLSCVHLSNISYGVLIAGALAFSAVGVEAMGGGNGPDAFIGIINGELSLTTTVLSPTLATALSPTTTALEEGPSKRTPAIDSATFAGMAKEAMADVATKAAITAGTEKADH